MDFELYNSNPEIECFNSDYQDETVADNVIDFYPERLKKLGKASIEISDDDETIILGYD